MCDRYGSISKPINVSALGKCILAFLPFGEQKLLLEKIHYMQNTPRSIVTPEDMQKEIKQIQEQGYALDNKEYNEHLFCIAFPVRDFTGSVIASVSASFPEPPSGDHFSRHIQTLSIASKGISEALGYSQDNKDLKIF